MVNMARKGQKMAIIYFLAIIYKNNYICIIFSFLAYSFSYLLDPVFTRFGKNKGFVKNQTEQN